MRYAKKTAGFSWAAFLLLLDPPSHTLSNPSRSFLYDERGRVVRQEQGTNGDGKMDRWTCLQCAGAYQTGRAGHQFRRQTRRNGLLQIRKTDTARDCQQNDSQIDTWYYLNAKGEIERKGQDPNRSGKPTLWVIYENGQPVRSEEDTKAGGRTNRTVFFKNGKINRIDEDTKGSGKPDTFSHFENDQLVRKEMTGKASARSILGFLPKRQASEAGRGLARRREGEPGSISRGTSPKRDEDTAGRGHMDMIELFSQGQLVKRLRETKRGKWDILYYFKEQRGDSRRARQTNGTVSSMSEFSMTRAELSRRKPIRMVTGESTLDQFSGRRIGRTAGRSDLSRKNHCRVYLFKAGQVIDQQQVSSGRSHCALRSNSLPSSPCSSEIDCSVHEFVGLGDVDVGKNGELGPQHPQPSPTVSFGTLFLFLSSSYLPKLFSERLNFFTLVFVPNCFIIIVDAKIQPAYNFR